MVSSAYRHCLSSAFASLLTIGDLFLNLPATLIVLLPNYYFSIITHTMLYCLGLNVTSVVVGLALTRLIVTNLITLSNSTKLLMLGLCMSKSTTNDDSGCVDSCFYFKGGHGGFLSFDFLALL